MKLTFIRISSWPLQELPVLWLRCCYASCVVPVARHCYRFPMFIGRYLLLTTLHLLEGVDYIKLTSLLSLALPKENKDYVIVFVCPSIRPSICPFIWANLLHFKFYGTALACRCATAISFAHQALLGMQSGTPIFVDTVSQQPLGRFTPSQVPWIHLSP